MLHRVPSRNPAFLLAGALALPAYFWAIYSAPDAPVARPPVRAVAMTPAPIEVPPAEDAIGDALAVVNAPEVELTAASEPIAIEAPGLVAETGQAPAVEPAPPQPPAPAAAEVGAEREQPAEPMISDRLRRGQTLAAALGRHGVSRRAVRELVTSLDAHYDFRRAPAGARFELAVDGKRVQRFRFHPEAHVTVEAQRDASGQLVGTKAEHDLRVEDEEIVVQVETSLYQAIQDAGESSSLASLIAGVFAWDLDFSREQHRGDTFRMVVEKVYRGDSLIRYGRVLAAEYMGKRGVHRAYWFAPEGDESKGHYYLEDGRSAEKTFLASPVEYTRISSRFSKRRKHPILGFTKAHNGTDYAAPRGTPVRALANGVVRSAGWSGASGKLVVIQHDNGLTSYYAHLSRIQKGIRPGVRVRQKSMIGRVGSTGRSTGPHLHLGIKKNGRWIDPQKLQIRRSDPLPESYRDEFQSIVKTRRTRLAKMKLPTDRPAGADALLALGGEQPSGDGAASLSDVATSAEVAALAR